MKQTRTAQIHFRVRVIANQVRRTFRNRANPVAVPSHAEPSQYPHRVAESRTSLWTTEDPRELQLEAGKVHNLRLAAKAFDSRLLTPEAPFSFWNLLGRTTQRRGFASGRQLEGGCIVPALGGGICQLSSSLYEVALQAGLEITERHPHTARVETLQFKNGRDATVAWNHIDLRFRPVQPLLLRTELTETELIVSLWSATPVPSAPSPQTRHLTTLKQAKSCETCGDTGCVRHSARPAESQYQTAVMLDFYAPEWEAFIRETELADASVFVPSRIRKQAKYQWTLPGASAIATFPSLSLDAQVRLAKSAPERRGLVLARSERLAQIIARSLPPEARHLVIDVGYLAFLELSGALGGRIFDVLMSRPPLSMIHHELDRAASLFPKRGLLNDFRAPDAIVQAEDRALARAQRIITPHNMVSEQYSYQAVLIPWHLPAVSSGNTSGEIVHFGPVIARQGSFEVRDAARKLGFKFNFTGNIHEGSTFLDGLDAQPAAAEWWRDAKLVLAPSVIESQPRSILKAVAAGIPVITTKGSGIPESEFVRHIPFGDTDALAKSIAHFLPLESGEE